MTPRTLFLLLASLHCVSCSQEPTELAPPPPERRPTVTFAVSETDHAAAQRALSVLQTTCGGIRGLLTEIAAVRVSHETLPAKNERGWSRAIRVDMLVRSDVQYQGADIGGATLSFRLGGGTEPGIGTEHAVAQMLCGDVGTFRPAPALSFLETPPLPTKRVDFTKLFAMKRAGAIAMLGEPSRDPDLAAEDPDDPNADSDHIGEIFHVDLIKITLEYRDSLVSRAFVSSSVLPNSALLQWIGDVDPALIHLDAADEPGDGGYIWVNSRRLPRQKVDARRVLGATRAEVQRYLGPTEFGDETWRRDGYMLHVMFDDSDVVRYFDVSFDPGIRPGERMDEIQKWMGLPAGDKLTIRGRNYVSRADILSMTWERRYL